MREKLNSRTLGLAAGPLGTEPLRLAAEIARVVDDGDALHVLPIVTSGTTENIEALLFLRAVDAAIINVDALEALKTAVPNIQERIAAILSLAPSQILVFVRPEIGSLDDLRGRRVDFNREGSAAAYSGPLVFDKLKLDVRKEFLPYETALTEMSTGENDMAAVVFVSPEPVSALAARDWPPGFKLLPLRMAEPDVYLLSRLTVADYPNLIPQGTEVATIAVPSVLATYNWPLNSDRYNRVARLTNTLFDRLDRLRGPGFDALWKEVAIDAQPPGMIRFPAAQEWILRQQVKAQMSGLTGEVAGAQSPPAPAPRTTDAQGAQQQRLFQEFLEWRKHHSK